MGPFRRIAGGTGRTSVAAVDVDSVAIVYSDRAPESRVVLLRPGARPVVLASSDQLDFPAVALAGRYAGWLEQARQRIGLYVPRALVVYDLRARRVAYRLDPAAFAPGALVGFDLQRNGTVAFGANPTLLGGSDGGVGWASISEPRPHLLPGNAIPFDVRLAAGRIAFVKRECCVPTPFELVVESLDGRVVMRRAIVYGGFDSDGHRIVHLTSPKHIAVQRFP